MLRTFAKYEALGNDFIVLDAVHFEESLLTPKSAAILCDRHRGIGADGVLWIERLGPLSARLVIINADGSRPEMCGNGVRCIASYFADEYQLQPSNVLQLSTDAGPRPVTLVGAGESAQTWISSVDMGTIVVHDKPFASFEGASSQQQPSAFYADAGNPHAVILGEVAAEQQEAIAQQIRSDFKDQYPHGTNVEFVTSTPGHSQHSVRVRVHERGVGWTLACGTGACAVSAVLAARENTHNQEYTVRLDGGTLSITVRKVEASPSLQYKAVMVGPARRTFAGTFDDRGLQ